MRLLLIRHAQTPANVRGELATARPGPGLTRLGHEQAAAIPGVVAMERISGVYVSPLRRTGETAGPLGTLLDIRPLTLEGVEEIEAGELEDRRDMPSVRTYLHTVFAWADGDLGPRMPGSVDGHEFFARFDGAIASLAEQHPDDSTIAVVSHGAAIRVWSAARARNLAAREAVQRHLDNTGIVALTGSPGDDWLAESWEGRPLPR